MFYCGGNLSNQVPNFLCVLNDYRPFDVRLENPHVIDSSQVWVGVISNGPSGRPLNSSYRTRDSVEYKLELGNTIGMPWMLPFKFCSCKSS